VPLIIQAVFPIGLGILTVFCVESPTWYVQKGRLEEARKTLRSIRAYSDAQVDDELRAIVNNETRQKEMTGDVKFWDIFHVSKKIFLRSTHMLRYNHTAISTQANNNSWLTLFMQPNFGHHLIVSLRQHD
jgi:hypothetical protein